MGDAGERAALLPDAFTPPGSDAADDGESDEMQLSTTPLRLLNAVDARISMLQARPPAPTACNSCPEPAAKLMHQ